MPSTLRVLIGYRLRSHYREVVHHRGSPRRKVAALLSAVIPIGIMVIFCQVYRLMATYFRAQAAANPSVVEAALDCGLLGVGILLVAVLFMELVREIDFARDRELFHVAPVQTPVTQCYQLCFAFLRSIGGVVAALAFPVVFIAALPGNRWTLLVLAFCTVAYGGWLVTVAFFASQCLSLLAPRARISKQSFHGLLWIAYLGVTGLTVFHLLNPDLWGKTVAAYPLNNRLLMLLPHHEIGRIVAASERRAWGEVALLGVCFFALSSFSTIALKRAAHRIGATAAGIFPGLAVRRGTGLWRWWRRIEGESLAWAVLRKDFKDLVRNPAHRIALFGCFAPLPAGLFIRLRGAGSWNNWEMTYVLTMLCLVPLIYSGRVMALEGRGLDLYRLALHRAGELLNIKWRAQSILNFLAVLVLSIPYLLFRRGGEAAFEIAFVVTSALAFVPLFTMFAIAMGIFFPQLGPAPSPLGVKLRGVVVYAVINAVFCALLQELYSRLADGGGYTGILGTLSAYAALLVLFSWLLFQRAKARIQVF